jgi:hypothetical protein
MVNTDAHALPRLFSRPDRFADPLYIVTTVFNSVLAFVELFLRH